jgi:hypothetical protein
MNLKKAKAIRGLVKELVKKEALKMPWVQYGTVDHTKSIKTDKLDESGKPVYKDETTKTRVCLPMSPRGVYLRMKEDGPLKVLVGLK